MPHRSGDEGDQMTNSNHIGPSWLAETSAAARVAEQIAAEEITRRVNAHDELVAALRAACDLLRKRGVGPGDPTYAAARAALAKVEA